MRRYLQRLALLVLVCPAAFGCHHAAAPGVGPAGAAEPAVTQAPLPLEMEGAALRESIVDSQRKRVAGRLTSYGDIERIVNEDGPIVAEAARQPAVEAPLRLMARDAGISLEEARRRWIAVEEADLLLESGGNPDDVSSANAVGVAQWIYETGTHAGLRVDRHESNRLTALIDPLKRQAAWCEYLASPGADPRAPGAPSLSPRQAAARQHALGQQVEVLRAKRRKVDQRYDPRPSLFVHARYLLALYPRFPSLDWIMQAFHGGEAGVERELKRYLGGRWHGSAEAIRHGRRGGWLRYEDVYVGMSPTAHPACFRYIYGRLDDHRYYWWKVCAAQRAIAAYRRDPAAFRRDWEALRPGRPKEALWYPGGERLALADSDAVQAAARRGALVVVSPIPGVKLTPTPTLLRPQCVGLLRLLTQRYRSVGGKAQLVLLQGTVSQAASAAVRPTGGGPSEPGMPPLLPSQQQIGGGPPVTFDYHTTGLAFDLKPPADALQRKTLEYALGFLSDRGILWWYMPHDHGFAAYHVVPNPRHRDALAAVR